MRPGQQNRRGRNRGSSNGGSSSPINSGNRKPQSALSRNYESNGPDVKIRGSAQHIAEKYLTLARDAQSSGDRIMAESYLQHAEHYIRIIMTAQAQMQQPSDQQPGGQQQNGQHGRPRRQEGELPGFIDSNQVDDDAEQVTAAPAEPGPVGAPQEQQSARHGINGRRRRTRYQSEGDGEVGEGAANNPRRSMRRAPNMPGQSEQPDIDQRKAFEGRDAGEKSSDQAVEMTKSAQPAVIDISKGDIVV